MKISGKVKTTYNFKVTELMSFQKYSILPVNKISQSIKLAFN